MIRLLTSLSLMIFGSNITFAQSNSNQVFATIDLNNVKNDRVNVIITPPKFTTNEVVFHIPKTVPGTYSIDNYGKLIEEFKALGKNGVELKSTKIDENSLQHKLPFKTSGG